MVFCCVTTTSNAEYVDVDVNVKTVKTNKVVGIAGGMFDADLPFVLPING